MALEVQLSRPDLVIDTELLEHAVDVDLEGQTDAGGEPDDRGRHGSPG
jgi:hypothetical protein